MSTAEAVEVNDTDVVEKSDVRSCSSKQVDVSGPRSEAAVIRSKRTVIKRRITTTIRKLDSLLLDRGSKTAIKGYVNNVTQYLREAELLNDRLAACEGESEHENILLWYEEELERVEDIKMKAESQLEERLHEEISLPSQASSGKSSSKAAEARAKAISAKLRAQQLVEKEKMRKIAQEKQEELDMQAKRAAEMANRARIEADQRMKIQEARYEAIRLNAEANILENVERDP